MPGKNGRKPAPAKSAKNYESQSYKNYTENKEKHKQKLRELGTVQSRFSTGFRLYPINESIEIKPFLEEAAAGFSVPKKIKPENQDDYKNQNPDVGEKEVKIQQSNKFNVGDEATAGFSMPKKSDTKNQDDDKNQNPDVGEKEVKIQQSNKFNVGDEATAGLSMPKKSDTKNQDDDKNQNPDVGEKEVKIQQSNKFNVGDEATAGLSMPKKSDTKNQDDDKNQNPDVGEKEVKIQQSNKFNVGDEATAGFSMPKKSDTKNQDDDKNQNPDVGEKEAKIKKIRDETTAAPFSTSSASDNQHNDSDSDDDSYLYYCSKLNLGRAKRNGNFVSGTRDNAGRAGHGRHGTGGRPVTLARSSYSLNRGTRSSVQYRYCRKFYQNQSPAKRAPPIPHCYYENDDEEVYPIINDNEYLQLD